MGYEICRQANRIMNPNTAAFLVTLELAAHRIDPGLAHFDELVARDARLLDLEGAGAGEKARVESAIAIEGGDGEVVFAVVVPEMTDKVFHVVARSLDLLAER